MIVQLQKATEQFWQHSLLFLTKVNLKCGQMKFNERSTDKQSDNMSYGTLSTSHLIKYS